MTENNSNLSDLRYVVLVLLALLVLMPVQAAPKKKTNKHATLTHNYKSAPLRDVLSDIAKRCDYELVYDAADVDLDKRITMRFKDAKAKTVLKKVLDSDLQYSIKKNKIFITRKPEPPTEYRVTAVLPAEVNEDSVRIVSHYVDTLFSITCRNVTVEHKSPKKEVVPTRKGHYIQPSVGLGYASLGYGLRDAESSKVGANRGDFGGNVRVQYAYMFNENWGVAAGVGLSGYGSYGVLNHTVEYADQTTSNGDPYTHLTSTHDYKEHQVLHTVDIPVSAQYQYALKNNWHLYAGLGVQLGIPVYNRYQLKSGILEQSGRFPQWGMTIYGRDLEDHDFYTEHFTRSDKQAFQTKMLAVGVTADLGVMIPVTPQIDVMAGAYAVVNCNNIATGDKFDYDWRNYADTYAQGLPAGGMVQSSYANVIRPYQVGVRVGISWHAKPVVKEVESTYERIQTCDTTRTLIDRRDTVIKPVQPAAKEIQRLMRKSVIWFAVNSSVPKLEPADILDKVAEVLLANPDQKVIVSGHASAEGNARKNRILSEQRAKVVADMLMEKGVPASQIKVEAHSSDMQYQTEDGAEHSISLDRRTEIIPVE